MHLSTLSSSFFVKSKQYILFLHSHTSCLSINYILLVHLLLKTPCLLSWHRIAVMNRFNRKLVSSKHCPSPPARTQTWPQAKKQILYVQNVDFSSRDILSCVNLINLKRGRLTIISLLMPFNACIIPSLNKEPCPLRKNETREIKEKGGNSTCLRGRFWLVSIVLVQSEETTRSATHIPYIHFAVCT